jgi:hypothetical protein
MKLTELSNIIRQVIYESNELPSTISVNGKQRPTINSNRKPIASTNEGILNFWKWFDDSATVDEHGLPYVFIHGSDKKFSKFDINKEKGGFHGNGFYFAKIDLEYGNVIYASYLKMKTPFDINGEYTVTEIKRILGKKYKDIKPTIEEEVEISYNGTVGGFVFYNFAGNELLQRAGYDGIIQANIAVVFSPSQIKSAAKNNGNFNPNSDNMNENIQFIELLEEINHTEYLSWKRKNVTLRGMSNKDSNIENGGMAKYGSGLYTAALGNKSMAREYGKVYFVVNAIPKKPKKVYNTNEAEIFLQQLVTNFCKEHNVPRDNSFFSKNTTIGEEMKRQGYDGLIIQGREMVNYTPPDDIQYFTTEDELKQYYERITR